MKLHQLEYFCKSVQCNSLKEIEETMYISQSAFYKAINSLEKELGCKLYHKVGRRMEVTAEGMQFYMDIYKIIDKLESVVEQVRLEGKREEKVRVLFSSTNYVVPQIYEKLNKKKLGIEVSFLSSFYPSNYEKVDYDFHIYASPVEPYNLVLNEWLMDEGFQIAYGAMCPLAKIQGDTISMEELKDYEWQSLPPGENLYENMCNLARDAGFKPRIALMTQDSYSFLTSLASGPLIALIPERTIDLSGYPEIFTKKLLGENAKRSIYIGSRTAIPKNEACATFKEYIMEYFSTMDAIFSKNK